MTRILCTGSSGMIGKELVELLEKRGDEVIKADIKLGNDLRDYSECLRLAGYADEIYHLAGIKGSAKMTKEKPVDFMAPMLRFDTNMILSALETKVNKFLYTSSIAVLNPETDKFPAWAKQTGETLIEAIRVQHPETNYCIVRPANVYGRFDNFQNHNSMVITSLIRKALNEPYLEIWGTGEEERDFINSRDVARGMIETMNQMPKVPINLCSGENWKIRQIAGLIRGYVGRDIEIRYKNQEVGAFKRPMAPNGEIIGFKPEIHLTDGIKECVDYARRQLC